MAHRDQNVSGQRRTHGPEIGRQRCRYASGRFDPQHPSSPRWNTQDWSTIAMLCACARHRDSGKGRSLLVRERTAGDPGLLLSRTDCVPAKGDWYQDAGQAYQHPTPGAIHKCTAPTVRLTGRCRSRSCPASSSASWRLPHPIRATPALGYRAQNELPAICCSLQHLLTRGKHV